MNIIKRNIPNMVTCMNLVAGFLSIVCAFKGSEELWGLDGFGWAWIFIGIAAAADFLDGFMARLLHAYSNLGKELDSLCDLVSFGVAPAFIMFSCLAETGAPAWTLWFVIIIPVCGALRLARFNIDTRQTSSFIGLPIPANAIFWIGYSALSLESASALSFESAGLLSQWWCVVPVMIVESWLMLSPLKLFSLKFKTWGWKGNGWRWLLIVTAVVMVTCMGVPGLMWLIVAYVLYGLLNGGR